MKEVSQKALREAVEQLYKCSARHTGTEHVTEIFQGETAWDGDVHVFALEGHPSASVAYAWSSPVLGSDRRRFFTLLKTSPVLSPQDAVRASIASQLKNQ